MKRRVRVYRPSQGQNAGSNPAGATTAVPLSLLSRRLAKLGDGAHGERGCGLCRAVTLAEFKTFHGLFRWGSGPSWS
jgi:hypothetical protein